MRGKLLSGDRCGLLGLSSVEETLRNCVEHTLDLVLPLTPRGERREIFVTNSCPLLVESCTWDVGSLACAASLSLVEQGPKAERVPR